jgi:hypothetical protein
MYNDCSISVLMASALLQSSNISAKNGLNGLKG